MPIAEFKRTLPPTPHRMDPALTIRRVQKSDEPLLAAIIRETFDEHQAPKKGTVYSDPTTDHLFDLFAHPDAVLWVAEWDTKVVGCCGVYPTTGLPAGTAELVKFYISSPARGRQIGKQLMNTCITSAKELGYKSLYLESMPQFSTAVDFYTRLGFTMLSHSLGNSGHPSCSIWMWLSLENR